MLELRLVRLLLGVRTPLEELRALAWPRGDGGLRRSTFNRLACCSDDVLEIGTDLQAEGPSFGRGDARDALLANLGNGSEHVERDDDRDLGHMLSWLSRCMR